MVGTKRVYGPAPLPKAKKAKLAKKVISATTDLGKEIKQNNVDFAGTFNATGEVLLLNGIANGTTNTTRIGRKIKMTSLEMRAFFSAAADSIAHIRVLVVYDKQANEGQPGITAVIDDPATTPKCMGLKNMNNIERFQILYDKELVINDGGGRTKLFYEYIKLALPTRYDGTGDGDADITSGSLWLMILDSVEGTASTYADINLRTRFSDL